MGSGLGGGDDEARRTYIYRESRENNLFISLRTQYISAHCPQRLAAGKEQKALSELRGPEGRGK
jgi:hypothetical protein